MKIILDEGIVETVPPCALTRSSLLAAMHDRDQEDCVPLRCDWETWTTWLTDEPELVSLDVMLGVIRVRSY
jgi:hypothetical protein